jgi:hypothetical protein
MGGPDGHAPPVDIFRPPDLATPVAGDQDVVVPDAK